MTWKRSQYLVARGCGLPEREDGLAYKGLGIAMMFKGSPKGRRPPTWSLTHLGSGHVVCTIDAHEAKVLIIATEIADCGDWEFEGLKGYVNRDPDLPDKFREIQARYPEQVKRNGGRSSDEAARAVAMANA